jgi:serine phosphatase RsbU (regulator of sigma subunit)/anti-sigma regulatory factor (Ser/Thr protein kinase)
MDAVGIELVVSDAPDAVPLARREVARALAGTTEADLDDVNLVVTELVTNGLLHGRRPVLVRAVVVPDGVRVEVEDSGRDLPVLPVQSTEAMTGRGLALVARVSAGWGVQPATGGGKVVWAEVRGQTSTAGQDTDPGFPAEVDVDALLAAFADDEEELHTVEVGAVPTDLLLEAKAHIDNVVREFTLEAAAQQPGSTGQVPSDLAQLVATVVGTFSVARNAIKRQALAAAQRGDREVRLSLSLPLSAADAGERYLAALDEADRYARNARLLTLETPPVHRVFRRWYVLALVDALRAVAAGQPVPLPPTLADMLGQALTRAAPLEEQAARLEVLQRVTAQLSGAASVQEVAQTVVEAAAEDLGAHNALLYLLDDEGLLKSTASAGNVRTKVMVEYDRLPLTPDLPAPYVLLTGQMLVVRDRADLVRRFPALEGVYVHELSLLIAPILLGDKQLGVLSLSFSGRARVEEQTQRAFLTTLADVTAQALGRAQATSEAAQATERLRFLAEASVVLSSTLDHRRVLEAVADLVVPRLADWCSIQLLQGDRLEPVALAHVDPAKVQWAKEFGDKYPADMESPTGAGNVLRTGETAHYPDIPDEALVAAAVDDEHLRLIRELGMSSVLMVPLVGMTGTLGVVTMIASESGRRYDAADVAFAEDLARRAALAVENAHAFREQTGRLATVSRVAEAAQQAILSPPPPRMGPVSLAARYVSAAAEALIGGDLYEVVRRPGAVRLLIGDVRGKGLGAVRTATVVLGAWRTAASDVDDLSAVAVQVERHVRDHLASEDFVTALMAEVRDDGSYTIACCGHPPPLLANADALVRIDVLPSVPLGLGTRPELSQGRLAPGDRLLLYTDGILEARDREHEFVDLMRLVEPLRTGDLDAALDGVLERLHAAIGAELGDDLCLLVAEYRP